MKKFHFSSLRYKNRINYFLRKLYLLLKMRMISNLLHPAALTPCSQHRRILQWTRIRAGCSLFLPAPAGCLCRHCPLCIRLSICGGFFLPVQTCSAPRQNHRCHRRLSQQYLFLLSLRLQCPLHRRKGAWMDSVIAFIFW